MGQIRREAGEAGASGGRPIRKREQAFLERELAYWRQSNLMNDGQAAAIAGLYEPVNGRFLQIFMGLGALLVGLGLLSYIAANWMTFGRALKVALIIGGYLFSLAVAYGFEPSYPYTSRAFLLLGSFVYGGGIFLIAQIFNEGGSISGALLWWMAGAAPACLLFKDRMQLVLIQGISLIYYHWFYRGTWQWLFSSHGWSWGSPLEFLLNTFISIPFAVLAGLWILWRLSGRWRGGFHLNIFITLNFIGIHLSRYCRDGITVALLFFVIGLLLCAAPLGRLKNAFEGWGVILTGACGLLLSFPGAWRWSKIMEWPGMPGWEDFFLLNLNVELHVALSVIAAILACLALLWCIHEDSLLATSFFCLLVLRYYFDFFYDFMNKALYFTTGGLLVMATGFYLQRLRKKRKSAPEEAKQS